VALVTCSLRKNQLFRGFNELFEGLWKWERVLGIAFRWSPIYASGS
jgi:hypothetical protein